MRQSASFHLAVLGYPLVIPFVLASLIFLLTAGGCVAGKHGDTIYGSFLKDIDADGTVEVRPDGTKAYHIKVTSNVSAKMVEAAVAGAVRGAKP